MPRSFQPLQDIHGSLIVGQRGQMVKQINEYEHGVSEFFSGYLFYLTAYLELDEKHTLKYFSDCVISYHKIMSGDTIIEIK